MIDSSPTSAPGVRAQAVVRARLRLVAALCLSALVALPGAGPVHADAPGTRIEGLQAEWEDDGLYLSFAARFELPRAVEDALFRGLPLHFVAQAQVTRERWYWTDLRVAQEARHWRLAYQPLTRRYRVTFGGSLGQTYESLSTALAAIQRTARWRIALPEDLRADATHRVSVSFRLDTAQLPRPFQIGITGNVDWNLGADAALALEVPK